MPAPIGSQSPSFQVSQRPRPETYKIPDTVEGKANDTVLFCVGKTDECTKVITWRVVTLSSEVKFLSVELFLSSKSNAALLNEGEDQGIIEFRGTWEPSHTYFLLNPATRCVRLALEYEETEAHGG